MFNLAVYGVVEKVLFQAHTLKASLAMSLDMNDFVHVESLYLPRSASGSGIALRSTTKLLPTRVVPSIQEHPTSERTMRLPSARLEIPPSIEGGTGAEEFNVG